jgi:hypothetical protein
VKAGEEAPMAWFMLQIIKNQVFKKLAWTRKRCNLDRMNGPRQIRVWFLSLGE